jgi:hypothetical protein
MPSSATIKLEPYEYQSASIVAVRRVCTSISKNSINSHGFKGHGWNENVEGACAEMAVAKHLDIYWSGSNGTYKKADLSTNLEVRWTGLDGGSLIVRPGDNDDATFILVTGRCPTYSIRGFMKGKEAKNDRWLDYLGNPERPPAYVIPQHELNDINELGI